MDRKLEALAAAIGNVDAVYLEEALEFKNVRTRRRRAVRLPKLSAACAALLAVAACGCLLRQGWLLAAGYAMDALLAYAMYRKIKVLTFSLLPGDGSTFTED